MTRIKDYLTLMFSSRKFAAFVVYFAVATLFVWTQWVRITPDVYMAQITLGLGAFMASNIGEHITNTVKEWIKRKRK